MSDGKTAIWTPDGVVTLGGKKNDRVEVRAGVMEWFRQFADVAAALKIGMHCAICKSDFVGKNNDSDKAFAITCGCRDIIGPNRDYRPEPRH